MATKSILKNIDIHEKKQGKSLVIALEHASRRKAKEVTLSRSYTEVHGEQIKEIFCKNL